jgi:nucleoside 2-deoxyribosyltransferase
MNYSFKDHRLSDAEKLWLQEAARSTPFDVRRAKVKLFGTLPENFSPDAIDQRLYQYGKITLIGRWHVDRDSPLFGTIDRVISAIRTSILANPGIESLTAKDIAQQIELEEKIVEKALYDMGILGSFYSNGAQTMGADAIVKIQLSGHNAYDEYLRYKNLDDLLERTYIEHDPRQISSRLPIWPPLESGAMQTSMSEPLMEQKQIKRNTAFVLMAMDRTRADLEDIYNTIKEVCGEFGIVAYRADAIEHQDSITERILGEIRACEYLVADLSLERPNVYYEVGYAHAMNKKPILYRKTGTRLHFDLAVHNVPEYENNTELRRLLRKRLEAITGREPKVS